MGFPVRSLWILLLFIFLAACETQKTKPEETATNNTTGYSVAQIPQLLEKAAKAPPEEQSQLMLTAAETLVLEGEIDWARSIIASLPDIPLDETSFARRSYVNALLARADGAHYLAKGYLNKQRLVESLPRLPLELAIALREQRAQVFADIGDHAASVEERLLLSHLLRNDRPYQELNEELIWQTLMELPLKELKALQHSVADREAKGWYNLASLSKDNQTNVRQQLAQLDHWVKQWPDHPASLRLPADLQLLKQLVEEQPQQIALLLPLSGKLAPAANAIRDGIMAAFYQSTKMEGPVPDLRLYDTEGSDINMLYDQAVAEGAQLVVGPLDKENIAEIALRPEMPVPTLALNTIENPLGEVPGLYQFGLAVEDEARQTAQQAWRDGHRRALIFAPANNWGDRSVAAFQEEWEQLGARVINDYRFSGTSDYSRTLKNALELDTSEQRAAQIRQLIGPIEFEPRRRKDVDMIFLIAHAAQARQIKPTLAFHYAGDIPVYATSQVYSGQSDPKLDQDMNAIRFSTLPWFFATESAEKRAIDRFADGNPAYQRLYAFGVDVFHLYPRLRQLQAVKQATYYGYTGNLSLNALGQIERQQTWAQFVNGRAKLIGAGPTTVVDSGY